MLQQQPHACVLIDTEGAEIKNYHEFLRPSSVVDVLLISKILSGWSTGARGFVRFANPDKMTSIYKYT